MTNPQKQLAENEPSAYIDFTEVFEDPILVKNLNCLQSTIAIKDEVGFFRNLVNTSQSASQPYHRWARYREGYSGNLVRELILRSKLVPKSDVVIDPMCGSGSTLVSASELGFSCFGLDVSPFAVHLSNTKLGRYTTKELVAIESSIKKMTADDVAYNSNSWSPTHQACAKYFSPKNFKALLSIWQRIQSNCSERCRQFLLTCWLSILEDCSDRKKDGNGLATRPSVVNNVLERFVLQAEIMLNDFRQHVLPEARLSKAFDASALELSQITKSAVPPGMKVGAVIFSPPYANSFDYFESYKLELLLGGFYSVENFADARRRLIRNYRIGYGHELKSNDDIVERICQEIWRQIPVKEKETGVTDGRTRLVPNMLRGYFEDMGKVVKECQSALKTSGHMYIVVDQSAYVGKVIPTDLLLAKYGRDLGLKVKEIIRCRRANTSGQQLRRYPYLGKILRESIVVLEK